MYFGKEFKVMGKSVTGQIFGNWSKESHFALKLIEEIPLRLGEEELNDLIEDFVEIRNKIRELNVEKESSNDPTN